MELICVQYIFREDLKISPSEMAFYFVIIISPQPVKFIYGLISDNLQIFGFNRKPYIFIFGLLTSFCFLVLYFMLKKFSGL